MGELIWFVNVFLGVSVMVFIAGTIVWLFALLVAALLGIVKFMLYITNSIVRRNK